MKCQICSKDSTVLTKAYNYCNGCFLKALQKRVRKHVRVNKLFGAHDEIYVSDLVSKELVEGIMKGIPCKVNLVAAKDLPDTMEVVSLHKWTMDDENNRFLKALFYGEDILKLKSIVSVISVLTDEEVLKFAELKDLEFEPAVKDEDISDVIAKMQKRYGETKYSLAKSISAFESLKDK